MPPPSGSTTLETQPSRGRVHAVGAGPVGLLLIAALLQSIEVSSVRLVQGAQES